MPSNHAGRRELSAGRQAKKRGPMLLTGFEPFTSGQGLVLDDNPTAHIVGRVAARMPGLQSAVLPVSYERTPLALQRQFDEHQPQVWLGLGYAPHRTTLDIEVIALNIAHAERGDNDGSRPFNREVIPGAPAAYRTRLPVAEILDKFATHGVEARAAFHAGTFLCNLVFYLGCHRCEQGKMSLAAFIHVPPMEHYGDFEDGLSEVLKSLRPT